MVGCFSIARLLTALSSLIIRDDTGRAHASRHTLVLPQGVWPLVASSSSSGHARYAGRPSENPFFEQYSLRTFREPELCVNDRGGMSFAVGEV